MTAFDRRFSPNWGRVLACLAIWIVGGVSTAHADATLPAPPEVSIPQSYFGIHMHRVATTTPWPSASFGSWRLWDAYVTWPDLEPEKGKWKFSILDKYVALAEKHHASMVLPLGLSPAWASARPDERCSYQPGNAAEPRNLEDWRNYVRTVATRYKGRIRTYELWNEINDRGFYTGDVQQMVLLAREAHEALKEVDAGNILVSPSVYGEGRNLEWLDRFLAYGGGKYVDVIGYHFYVATGAPESMLPLIAKVKRVIASHGLDNLPLWNTEFGWLIETPGAQVDFSKAPQGWKVLNMDLASAYISRALILGWAAGVQRAYWYSWDNGVMGLLDEKRQVIKPAARGYARTSMWLVGSVMKSCDTDPSGVWYCELSRNRRSALVVWRPDGELDWRLPGKWQMGRAEFLDGQAKIPSKDDPVLRVGQEPILIVEDGRSWSVH